MKFGRFYYTKDTLSSCWIEDDRVGLISGSIFGEYRRLEAHIKLKEIKLLSPVVPTKIIGLARNYAEHALEQGVEVPESLCFF